MTKPRILFVMHMPPPIHGAAVMGAQIRDSRILAETFECRHINLSSSVTLEEIGRGRLRKLLFVARLLRLVRRSIREWKPDLVYVTPTSTLPALFKDCSVVRLARRCGCSVLLHFHNKGVASRSGRWLDDKVYRRLFAQAGVILLSDVLRPDVEKYVPADRIAVCPNGLDLPPVPDRNPHGGVPCILFLSNLLPDKGIVDLLDACILLKKSGISFRCRVVGAPTAAVSENSFRYLVADRNLEDIVAYSGPLYGSDKQDALREADLLVHPTREDCFPLVILEAMAAGLPVVSTREGGIPDEVEDGVTGVLCEKGNPAALAASLTRLLKDAPLRKRMGIAGRARYENSFTSAAFERRIVDILRSYV